MEKDKKRFGLYPGPGHCVTYDFSVSNHNYKEKKKPLVSVHHSGDTSDEEVYDYIFRNAWDKSNILIFMGMDEDDLNEDELKIFEELDLSEREAVINFITDNIERSQLDSVRQELHYSELDMFYEDLEMASREFESVSAGPLAYSFNHHKGRPYSEIPVISGSNLKKAILKALAHHSSLSDFFSPISVIVYEDEVLVNEGQEGDTLFSFSHDNFIEAAIEELLDGGVEAQEVLEKYKILQYHIDRCWRDNKPYPLDSTENQPIEPFKETSKLFFKRSFMASIKERILNSNPSRLPDSPYDLGYKELRDLLEDSFLPALSVMGSYYGNFFNRSAFEISNNRGVTISEVLPSDFLVSLEQSSQLTLEIAQTENTSLTDAIMPDANFFDAPAVPRSVTYCQLLFR